MQKKSIWVKQNRKTALLIFGVGKMCPHVNILIILKIVLL